MKAKAGLWPPSVKFWGAAKNFRQVRPPYHWRWCVARLTNAFYFAKLRQDQSFAGLPSTATLGFELTINIKVPANSARNSLVVFDRIRSNIVT